MRRKLQRILRYNTEELSPKKQALPKNQCRLSNLSINKFYQIKRHSQVKEPFQEKSINLTNIISKSKSNFRIVNYQNLKSNRNLKSTKIEEQQSAKRKTIKKEEYREPFIKVIENQINKSLQPKLKGQQKLGKIVQVIDQISEQIYSYTKVQGFIQILNAMVKNIGSKSLIFIGYCFSVQCLYLYGSYSLSIFYSDKALKFLSQKEKIHVQERQAQLELYRTIAKIFLIKNQFKTAKHFGYKFLRKSWYLNNFQRQLDAYDLLGKIYHECQEKSMSIYFHQRMCKGERQNEEMMKISNYELEKVENDMPDFAVYETIEVFVKNDQLFHQMLEDRYKMKTRSSENDSFQSKTQFYFHTNRSPNRNLDTYRNLERKMIEEKKSKELHFIKPKQKNNLKKLINTFQKLIIQVKDQFEDEFSKQVDQNSTYQQ